MTTSKNTKNSSSTMRFLDDLIGEPLTFGTMLTALRECEAGEHTCKNGLGWVHWPK